jgi:hypothetical protein
MPLLVKSKTPVVLRCAMELGESRELVSPARGSGDMTGTEMSAPLLDFDLTDFYHLRSIPWLIEHLFAHANIHIMTCSRPGKRRLAEARRSTHPRGLQDSSKGSRPISVHMWKSAPVGAWIPRITPSSYGYCNDTYSTVLSGI